MINMLQPTITMSVQEFLQISRGELDIKELKLKRKIEKEGIVNNLDDYLIFQYKKALKKRTIVALESFIVTTLALSEKILAAVNPKEVDPKVIEAMKKVDHGGWMIMFIFRKLSFWICIILCILEILKCVTQGDIKSVGKIIVRYILIYGVSYFLPIVFQFIEMLFE